MAQVLADLKEKAFQKELKTLNDLLRQESPDLLDMQVQVGIVQHKFTACAQAQHQLMDELLAAQKLDEYQAAEDTVTSHHRSYDKATRLVTSLLHTPPLTPAALAPDTRLQLPKRKLPEFSGDIRTWLSFWSGFEEIHNNASISDGEKFQYLIQCIPAASRARKCIDAFPVSGKNYHNAVEALRNNFGREPVLVKVYMRDLLKLALKNVNEKDQMDLTELVPTLTSQIKNLEELGVTSDKCEMVLYPVVESCIPDDTLQLWQRHSGFSEKLDDIMAFLNQEVQNKLERSLARMDFTSSTGTTRQQKKGNSEKLDVPTASSLMITSGDNSSKKRRQCAFCKSDRHHSRKCQKAKEMTPQERMEVVRKQHLCFNCLNSGHQSSDCGAKKNLKCSQCNGTHCELMCRGEPQQQHQVSQTMMVPSQQYPTDYGCDQRIVQPQQSQQQGQQFPAPGVQYQVAPAYNIPVQQQQPGRIPVSSGQGAVPQSNSSYSGRPAVGFINVANQEKVALNTLVVSVETPRGTMQCRAFIDSGSQLSYVELSVAQQGNCESAGQKTLRHQIFEGRITEPRQYPQFWIKLRSLQSTAWGIFSFNGVPRIAQSIENPPPGKWIQELRSKGIPIQDQSQCSEKVQLLIGMDVLAQIKTGGFHRIDPFFVAEETIFGWTVGGTHVSSAVPAPTTTIQMVTTMMLGNLTEEQLWGLESIGITDEATTQPRQDLEAAAVSHFEKTVSRLPDGRYECRLPWIEGHRQLLSNRKQATARLHLLTKVLRQENYLKAYHNIIQSWMDDGVIEVVPANEGDALEYFLPHRHVVKDSSTTPVRPVFDASSKVKGSPSLNESLEKGPNMLERIPAVVTRFRHKKFGIVSDIRKAFLQISVHPEDRKVLQFFWWKDEQCKEPQLYRHKRVVFGVSSSPFLLAATLQHHLKTECHQIDSAVAEELLQSFYVDNSCSSHGSLEEALDFKAKSSQLLALAQMDLRGWEHGPSEKEEIVPVLGMLWNTKTDKLSLSLDGTLEKIQGASTKRGLLSAMNAVFDPMGFAFPFTITPKFLFQKCCMLELKWDEELPDEIAAPFQKWKSQVPTLASMHIPRWIGTENVVDTSFHIFSDASCVAFSCCVFQRTITTSGTVNVQLMVCKTRVAPSKKKVTIPRLELLGCLIGVRLLQDVKKYLNQPPISCTYWTDSSTALAWIKNDRPWARFVQNRVDEIRKFTRPEDWRHIPGEWNPADLPSRGCDAASLMQLQWWEGPEWLRNTEEDWPNSRVMAKEEDVLAEAKKSVVSCHALVSEHVLDRLKRFSSYHTLLRVVSIVRRYLECLRQRAQQRKKGAVPKLKKFNGKLQLQLISAEEIQGAERCIVLFIQAVSFSGQEDDKLKKLATFVDEYGVIRIRSQLFFGEDGYDMRCPAVLPSTHDVAKTIIRAEHHVNSHAGVQTTLAILRNRFWILKGRRTVGNEIGACLQCRRFLATKCQVPGTTLPKDRITSSAAFEITGVDLLGPLFLFGGEKVWVVLFTCAVYRCVHLEVTPTLSTEGFMRAFRRFVARRGRPAKVYSDNGLNFVGCNNLFASLDWDEIRRYAAVQRMEWTFIPPTAAWWGGFWERLVGLTKNLLRRILGKKVVAMEELCTIMCDVEATLNERPLTYLSDKDPVVPLTPAMFLKDNETSGIPEADAADVKSLRGKVRRMQSLREQLRSRFRKEYLGQLQHHAGNRSITVKPGDVVIISHDDKKRLDWPCGVVKQVFPGRDGRVRTALVKTKDGEYLRPLQRLYIMEATLSSNVEDKTSLIVPERDNEPSSSNERVSRAGRRLRKPDRLGF